MEKEDAFDHFQLCHNPPANIQTNRHKERQKEYKLLLRTRKEQS